MSVKDDYPVSDSLEGTEIQMYPEFCVWRDSQNMEIFLVLMAVQRAVCILSNHAFRQEGGTKKNKKKELDLIWSE